MSRYTLKRKVHFQSALRTQKKIKKGKAPEKYTTRIQRISKLMALAVKFDFMLKRGEFEDMAQIARNTQVTRARITQIMNLNLLAPSIQEMLLFLPETDKGRDVVTVRDLQKVALEPDWAKQQTMLTGLL
ncbi:MAG: hypothetical protein ACIAQZ_11800 [Sedimentisphaeraceae bacterium JB056]